MSSHTVLVPVITITSGLNFSAPRIVFSDVWLDIPWTDIFSVIERREIDRRGERESRENLRFVMSRELAGNWEGTG